MELRCEVFDMYNIGSCCILHNNEDNIEYEIDIEMSNYFLYLVAFFLPKETN
ncbi:unnamed protein product [Trifolium pratense]|uniref:Uncharacterized protein n=1 Tax=Trifolium pratense TaxID=57577 RepID=A0ACB0K7G7_TRIPR|nr:unnamed protein product [Trifolium pratense]